MRIDEKSIFYWSLLGFKIGGLEFLWDSPYKEAQDLFEQYIGAHSPSSTK